jgi:hypothetical protein
MIVLDDEKEVGVRFSAFVERSMEACGEVIDVIYG